MKEEENNTRVRIQKSSENKVIQSLISGSLSSTFTTILYQPLELLKTNIQLRRNENEQRERILGRSTKSASNLIKLHGISYLWRGTAASLVRSVPGVGIYYASLNILQSNFSENSLLPNNSTQAFYFGLTARSLVSFILAPITVVKVRYESGRHIYPSLKSAILEAYLKNGWVGLMPTILRDSTFSGIYYMCYTKLKLCYLSKENIDYYKYDKEEKSPDKTNYMTNFTFGIVSGLVASIVTNPLDVIKTNIQVEKNFKNQTMMETAILIYKGNSSLSRFFDGLVPRCLRRTLIAASTWTFFEFFMNNLHINS